MPPGSLPSMVACTMSGASIARLRMRLTYALSTLCSDAITATPGTSPESIIRCHLYGAPGQGDNDRPPWANVGRRLGVWRENDVFAPATAPALSCTRGRAARRRGADSRFASRPLDRPPARRLRSGRACWGRGYFAGWKSVRAAFIQCFSLPSPSAQVSRSPRMASPQTWRPRLL